MSTVHNPARCRATLEGPEMGSDALRAEWRDRALPALFDGGRRNMSHWSEIVGGCQFIGIDNSTRYITPDQLDFFLSATAAGEHPVVLMMHIPLRLPGLMEDGRADGGRMVGRRKGPWAHGPWTLR